MSILNRRAKFDYEIKETYIAGLVLESNEVKPLRQGKASIQSSFINEQKGEIYINNFEIISVQKNFDGKKKVRSVKKLLLNKREIKKNETRLTLSLISDFIHFNFGPSVITNINKIKKGAINLL